MENWMQSVFFQTLYIIHDELFSDVNEKTCLGLNEGK